MPQELNLTQKNITTEQRLVLDNRKTMTVSGVENVDCFSEHEIILITNLGKLTIKGEHLNVSKLNVDTGDFSMNGYVTSLVYSKATGASRAGFLERLFK